MSLPWITINSRLQGGVSLINSLNRNKFNLLLKHIVQSETDEIFTQAELAKLSESLKLDDANVQLLIQSIAHIFKQASKVILKPTILQDQLVEKLKFESDKAEDFVKLWTQETKRNFDVENSKNLDNISWELNVEAASSFTNKERFVHSRLQMALVSVDGEEKENVVLELDEDELKHLYNTLEKIQNKLDSI
ncbi:COMM domain-containing protein 10 [Tribolium castaneum]|uniref:COMM domain-containing protein 10-like Protein n=1 Tax=Tribolium castaneum TaxID=7070 RepID=D6WCT4_TRICA|nr:PREDICTED: COMM domain-containing protein 10 [Tribolium castaneum]EEZ99059.1 COMM domain-containing protein 10-like Protein [Tribolium castaneum]|eukprot:XP_973616.1 PREDICTED: COMM domain-containing protein 10 [Tribolium castaneum]